MQHPKSAGECDLLMTGRGAAATLITGEANEEAEVR